MATLAKAQLKKPIERYAIHEKTLKKKQLFIKTSKWQLEITNSHKPHRGDCIVLAVEYIERAGSRYVGYRAFNYKMYYWVLKVTKLIKTSMFADPFHIPNLNFPCPRPREAVYTDPASLSALCSTWRSSGVNRLRSKCHRVIVLFFLPSIPFCCSISDQSFWMVPIDWRSIRFCSQTVFLAAPPDGIAFSVALVK